MSRKKRNLNLIFAFLIIFSFLTIISCKNQKEKVEEVVEERECQDVWRKIVDQTSNFIKSLGDIINLFGTYSSSPTPRIEAKQIKEALSDMDESAQKVMSFSLSSSYQNCFADTELPIKIIFGSTEINVVFKGRFGKAEADFIGSLFSIINAIFNLVFSHDTTINIADILSNRQKIDTFSLLTIIRSLGFVVENNTEFLTWSKDEEERKRFKKIPKDLYNLAYSTKDLMDTLNKRIGRYNYVISVTDGSEDGIIGYDYRNQKGRILDYIVIRMFGEAHIGEESYFFDRVSLEVPMRLTKELLEKIKTSIDIISQTVDCREAEDGLKCKREFFSVSDFSAFFQLFNLNPIEDILRFSPQRFFSSQKSLREYLPLTVKEFQGPSSGIHVFLIEGEISRKYYEYSLTQYFPWYYYFGDTEHFYERYPQKVTIDGREYDIKKIPKDCIEVLTEGFSSSAVIPYVYLKDPTFSNSLYLKFYKTCDNDEEVDMEEFEPATLYRINKFFARIFADYGNNIIFPILNYILKK